MKRTFIAILTLGILISCNSSEKPNQSSEKSTTSKDAAGFLPINSDEALIATALMAAPEKSRSECTVIGYNMAGEFVTFREGSNEFIVLVDNPKLGGFNAACYHKDLEPFMARGRALKAEGKSQEEIFAIREAEVKSGKLKMTTGSTLHIYYGPNSVYNPATSEVDGAKLRYVVYMPFATTKTTGLPDSPSAPNHPWLMDAGTHKAHIMISPLPNS